MTADSMRNMPLEPGLRSETIHPQLVAMHWLMAAMLVVAVAAVLLRGQLPSGHAWRPMARTVHLVAGQCVLAMVLLRLVLRWRLGMPPAEGVGRLATWAGRAVHGLLYGVMLAQPLIGILFLQAGGKPVAFFGWQLPTLIGEDKALHFDLKEAHQVIGLAFYGLVSMHVGAALWHHVALRNATLHRMLPWLPVRARLALAPVAGAMASAPAAAAPPVAWQPPRARDHMPAAPQARADVAPTEGADDSVGHR